MFKASRVIAAVVAAVGLGAGGAVWAASAASAAPAAPAVLRCTTNQLAVWVYNNPGGGAAGSFDLPIGFTNISNRPCFLGGYPGISALNARGAQLGSAGGRDPGTPSKVITIPAGGTANADMRLTDVYNFTPSACKVTTAAQLRVYPPGSKTALTAFFSVPVCSKAGPIFLHVQRVQAGTPKLGE
jgi:Protein of unknown function (DUF4232)